MKQFQKTQNTQITGNIGISDNSETLKLWLSDPPAGGLDLRVFRVFRKGLIPTSICLFTYLFICLFPPSAAAQELRSFTIIPPSISYTLNSGEKREGVMKVINDSSQALTFTAFVEDYIVQDSKGTPVFLASNPSERFSGASWIEVFPNEFTIAPHEKQLINYALEVPENAAPGGHYAGVIFKPNENIEIKGAKTIVQTRAANLFYISVNGAIKEQSAINKFFANSFQEYGPVKIQTKIKNFGDLHITPVGKITLTDLFGRIIQTKELDGKNIFPESERDYENSFGQKIMIGRYKATLLASYGKNNNLPLMADIYFWIFPWRLAILILLTLLTIALGIMYFRKKH